MQNIPQKKTVYKESILVYDMHTQVLRVLTSAIYFAMHPKVRWIDEWILEAWTKGQIYSL